MSDIKNWYLGAHVSVESGVELAPQRAADIGANAFALFTKNQRRWQAPPLKPKSVEQFKQQCLNLGIMSEHILPHDTYLINLGHPEEEGLNRSRQAFMDEMQRCYELGLLMLNFHPGNTLNQISEEECLAKIAESINLSLEKIPRVMAVIEITAGQGSAVGYRFEHIRDIISQVRDKRRVGVCFDTCHAFAAGYDISDISAFGKTFAEFNRIIGLDYLKAMHLNDTKKGLSSRVDRHENLGEGILGLECFKCIMRDERFVEIPLILETPDEGRWAAEIELLLSFIPKQLD